MYLFKDKGDRSITLKPEGTAPPLELLLKTDYLMKHSQQSFIILSRALDMKMYKREDLDNSINMELKCLVQKSQLWMLK